MSRPTNTQFAVASHVLLLLAAEPQRTVSSEEMAGSVLASPVYLRRVLGRLRQAGIVASRPGVGGGWQLERPATKITLGAAWRAVQGDDPVLGLHGPAEACPIGRSIGVQFTGIQDRVAHAIADELDHTTLAELVSQIDPAELADAAAAAG